ncbi:right-handed parallel beta-helix repeat-containing protein [Leptothoe sp. PORK10 BA2]|uniref:right-handed parallel beta-helix repeat-containing protein n=1 Tax=Leptothoe sp. PORK10 BA2 TaxID=3110254 RepID=UPI002B212264|nr:right-handed parallel beta-helix repeat-containing protein [Leptothoe sp. PORK10 BA2]MEA5465860.1 right-handed parallel beta-helix repeat-containing protein [Leptothoe sp. PORK10 BA2]
MNAQAPEVTETTVDNTILPRVGVDFNAPRNGDDERSFGRVTGFVPLWQTPGHGLTFLDTAVRLNSTGELGGTVTVGQRFLQGDVVLGGYLSYDIRDTGNNTFNQLGLGVEAFGELWDIHLNGYLPVGNTQDSVGSSGSSTSQITDTQFQGNQLVFITAGGGSEFLESAWGGVDLDAGMQLADWDDWGQLWGYGGVYYHGDAIGGRLRVDHRVQDWMRLGLGVQSDDNFGTRGFFSIGFNWGGGNRDSSDSGSLWARASESVTRNSSIVVKESEVVTSVDSIEVAINPATGQAYNFQHVIPNATSTAGNGTIENPTANVNLLNPQAGDIIYVRQGDSRTNPLAPFTVPAGVVAISDANLETIATQAGNVTLPGSGTGILPLVDATGSDVGITLTGGNNRLSGFEIAGATDVNIFVDSSDNALVENNFSRDDLDDGIEIFNSSNVTLLSNIFINSGDDAIDIKNSANAVISNNTISGSNDDGIDIIMSASPVISGNTFSDIGDDAIDFANSDNALIQNNTITNAFDSGIELARSANATIEGNSMDGGNFGVFAEESDNTLIQNNTISNSGSGAIFVLDSESISIQNNQATNTATDVTNNGIVGAIFLREVVGTTDISGNTVTGTTGTNEFDGQGIVIGNSTGDIALTIEDNDVNNNQGDGIGIALVDVFTTGPGNATADITVTNNRIGNNGVAAPLRGDGIRITVEEDSVVNSLLIEDNTLTGNLDDGIDISAGLAQLLTIIAPDPNISSSNAQILNAVIRNNEVTDSLNGQGILLRSFGDNSNIVISVESNTLTNNTLGGLQATSTDSNGVPETTLCLALNNNTSDGDYTLTETVSMLPITASNFTVVNRDGVAGANTGTVIFSPVIGGFGTVANIAACP